MRACCVALLSFLLLAAPRVATSQTLVRDVRAAITKGDIAAADGLVAAYRAEKGTTPEALAGLSWVGRGALNTKQYDAADRYARQTEKLVLETLKTRALGSDQNLVVALGAALEVQAKVMAETGQRASAVKYLQDQVKRYRNSPIHMRLTKNLNLISLEGQKAPRLSATQFLGAPMPDTRGKPVLMLFWAHWCPDCKRQVPIVSELERDYRDKGLIVIGPTKYYGYVTAGREAGKAEEFAHMGAVLKQYYSALPNMAVPVSDEDALDYGMDATPTIVLVDRAGIVRLFHPGNMERAELEPHIKALVAPATSSH
ncbi:MAG: TlpA disulfide reductase family protein [Vicinamibacterales bacterium]